MIFNYLLSLGRILCCGFAFPDMVDALLPMSEEDTYFEQHRETLEAILTSAISDLTLARPTDPIAFVAQHLRDVRPTVNSVDLAWLNAELAQSQQSHALERGDDVESWNLSDWLASDVARTIADALLRPLQQAGATAGVSQHAYVLALARLPPQSLKQAVHALVLDADLSSMSERIAHGVERMAMMRATSLPGELDRKFVDDHIMSRSFADGALEDFEGFESIWGPPRLHGLMEAMRAEHCLSPDSCMFFTTGNLVTTSQIEWHFVVAPEDPSQFGLAEWPAERWDVVAREEHEEKRRKPMPMQELLRVGAELSEMLKPQTAALRQEELCAARLFTGPLYLKYGLALAAGLGRAMEKARGEQLLVGNNYASTLHLINSAILKLSRLGSLQPVYRATSPASMFKLSKATPLGEYGTIELHFLHTSADRTAVVEYVEANDAQTQRTEPGMIIEILQDAEHRGADLAPLSQYPSQREIVFPPLSCLVLQRKRVESLAASDGGRGLVVAEMRVRSTAGAEVLDIEQYIERAKLQFASSCVQTVQEFRSGLPAADREKAESVFRGLLPEHSGLCAHPAEWFNDPENWAQATRTLSEARSAVWSKFTVRFFEVKVGGQLVRLRDLAHRFLHDEALAGGEMKRFTGSTLVLRRNSHTATALSTRAAHCSHCLTVSVLHCGYLPNRSSAGRSTPLWGSPSTSSSPTRGTCGEEWAKASWPSSESSLRTAPRRTKSASRTCCTPQRARAHADGRTVVTE